MCVLTVLAKCDENIKDIRYELFCKWRIFALTLLQISLYVTIFLFVEVGYINNYNTFLKEFYSGNGYGANFIYDYKFFQLNWSNAYPRKWIVRYY